ncbi:MAG: hypothetical protein O7D30_04100 [Rickettsia endosymbiont of Ixodes persulcatus]|nr:hypothetical protein [Rickettsia endosymbiont of Ixodes persulcatus]
MRNIKLFPKLVNNYRVYKYIKTSKNYYCSVIILLSPTNAILNSDISDTVFPSYILNPTPLNSTFALISAPYDNNSLYISLS